MKLTDHNRQASEADRESLKSELRDVPDISTYEDLRGYGWIIKLVCGATIVGLIIWAFRIGGMK